MLYIKIYPPLISKYIIILNFKGQIQIPKIWWEVFTYKNFDM